MTDRELMQQALDVINSECGFGGSNEYDLWAIAEALRERLAQPEQEPVAWRELCRRLYVELFHCDQQMMATLDEDGEPVWTQGKTVRDVLADAKAALETSPPADRKPLTDEEIAHATAAVFMSGSPSLTGIARAIEAAHSITGEQK